MHINGLQKLTLLDYPGKLACTVFSAGCNFRCPFCHNASLVVEAPVEELDTEEFFAFLEKRRRTLDGVCVTGGEPLLQDGLEEFLARIKALGYAVKLDTNGSLPDRLKSIVKSGTADYVAMDLKTAFGHYADTIGVPDFDEAPVRESAAFLLEGTVDYEFRTTVVKGLHDAELLRAAAQDIKGAKRYFLQKFVDSGDLIAGSGLSAFSDAEMKGFLSEVEPFVEFAGLRGV